MRKEEKEEHFEKEKQKWMKEKEELQSRIEALHEIIKDRENFNSRLKSKMESLNAENHDLKGRNAAFIDWSKPSKQCYS
jgi:predicted nuclease with TOPRIM domain